jgi:hypothetical protein
MGVAAGGSRRLMMAARPSRTLFTRSQIMATKKTSKKAGPAKAAAKKAPVKNTSAEKATTAKAKKPRSKSNGKLSAIDAAAKVLGETNEPMSTKQMIEAMAEKDYWKSPGGATPHATLYSAILREINAKGTDARFKKTERGKFTLTK